MSPFDPELSVDVVGNETSYSVVYFKRRGSSGLLAKNITNENDPRVPMTSAEFLAKAWKLANDKARELGWIV
jgi:hypothetical protein